MSTPTHYPSGTYEPIKVIEAWGLGFCLGNVVKYIARAGKKGDRKADLEKALDYLTRELEREQPAKLLDGYDTVKEVQSNTHLWPPFDHLPACPRLGRIRHVRDIGLTVPICTCPGGPR